MEIAMAVPECEKATPMAWRPVANQLTAIAADNSFASVRKKSH
jgi:hypothetical protein